MNKALAAFALAGIGALGIAAQSAHSAVLAVYTDLTSWSAAAGGTGIVQDFESFAAGANLSGVTLLPGISATTNMLTLTAFAHASGNTDMFGAGGRELGDAHYDIAVGQPYTRIAFDITAFEQDPNNPSTAQGPGKLLVFFADATTFDTEISGNLNGDPIFVGLVADTAITGIQWNEAQEGSGGNEETALDNLRVVPEPGTLALLGLGFAGFGWRRRRS
jgi:hypothetical protein